MIVGICWPASSVDQRTNYDGALMDLIRERTLASHLRTDFDHRRGVDEAIEITQHINAHGFKVLPILRWDYKNPSAGAYAQFCPEVARQGSYDYVELGNEPHTFQHIEPKEYADVFIAGARAIRESGISTKILIACEAVQAIGKKIDYFQKVRRLVPVELYDGLAVHPYRNPMPATSHKGFSSREDEANYYRSQSPGKEVHITEVGWDLQNGVDESLQAQYIYDELQIQEQVGSVSAFIYSYTEDPNEPKFRFGITDSKQQPRTACDAIRRFQVERNF